MKKIIKMLILFCMITLSSGIDAFAYVDGYVIKDMETNELYQYDAEKILEAFRNNRRYGEESIFYEDFFSKLDKNSIYMFHDDSGKYISYEEVIKEYKNKKRNNEDFDLNEFCKNVKASYVPEYVYNRIVNNEKVVNELNLTGDNIKKDLKAHKFEKFEDLCVTGDNISIENGDIKGTLTLDPGKAGSVFVNNFKADEIKVLSGGVNSIHLVSVEADILDVNSDDDSTRVECKEVDIGETVIRTYTVFDKVSGKVGTINVNFEQDVKKPILEFKGEFTEEIIVESSAELKTGKNAKISKVIVQPKVKESEIKFDGKFEKVEVTKEAKIIIADKANITKSIKIAAQAEINASEKANVAKVEIAPKNKNDEIKLHGNYKNIEVNKQAKVKLINVDAKKIVTNTNVNLNISKDSKVKQLQKNGHKVLTEGEGKKNVYSVKEKDNSLRSSGSSGSRRSSSGSSSSSSSSNKPDKKTITIELDKKDKISTIKFKGEKIKNKNITLKLMNKSNGKLEYVEQEQCEDGICEISIKLDSGVYYGVIYVLEGEKIQTEDFTI